MWTGDVRPTKMDQKTEEIGGFKRFLITIFSADFRSNCTDSGVEFLETAVKIFFQGVHLF